MTDVISQVRPSRWGGTCASGGTFGYERPLSGGEPGGLRPNRQSGDTTV